MIKKNFLKKIYETQKKIRVVEEKIAINIVKTKCDVLHISQ